MEEKVKELVLRYYEYLCNRDNRYYDAREVEDYLDREPQMTGQLVLAMYHSVDEKAAYKHLAQVARDIATKIYTDLNPKEKDL